MAAGTSALTMSMFADVEVLGEGVLNALQLLEFGRQVMQFRSKLYRSL